MEMLEEVSRADGPDDAVRAYAARIRRVRPIDAFVSVSVKDVPAGSYKLSRVQRADRPEPMVLAMRPGALARMPIQSGGLVGRLLAGAGSGGGSTRVEPRIAHDLSAGVDPVVGDAVAGMGSCMVIPVLDEGRPVSWSLMFRKDPKGYQLEDLEEEVLNVNLFGALTRHMDLLAENTALSDKLRAQFDEVARVQRALLPTAVPEMGGEDGPRARFAASYLTSGQAGGDYYDFLRVDEDSIGVFIADVSGHGPAAATVMAMLHAILHARPELWKSPAGLLEWANERLSASSIEGGHVTAVYGVLRLGSRELEFVRAGHPIPRVRSREGEVRGLESEAGPPMGIVAGDAYRLEPRRVRLMPGDTVVLYTDGVSETENPSGEQIGVEGLDSAIARAGADPGEVVRAVEDRLRGFRGSPDREDDQTLVVFTLEDVIEGS